MAKLYIRTGITGGSANDLDGVDGNILSNKDVCFTFSSGGTFVPFMLNETSGAASSSTIVAPAVNAGNKRWEKYST